MKALKVIESKNEALRKEGTPCDCSMYSENLDRPLRIFVPYTKPELTRSALAMAAKYVEGLNGHITLMFVQVVPFSLTLDKPNIRCDILAQRLMEKIGSVDSDIAVEVILARDRYEALRSVIPAGSLVLLTTGKRWWKTAEESLAHLLSKKGCSVNLVYLRASMLEVFGKLFFGGHYFRSGLRNRY